MIRCIALQKRSCASQAWHARNAFTPQLCIAVTNGHTVWHRWPFGQPAPQPPPLQCVLPNVPSALRRVHAYCYCNWYEGQALPEHPIGSSRGSWAIQAGDVAARRTRAVMVTKSRLAAAEAAAQSTLLHGMRSTQPQLSKGSANFAQRWPKCRSELAVARTTAAWGFSCE